MTLATNDFSEIVFNRRSIRQFDPTVRISREEMLEMIEQATKAPSSVNMQPWRFVVVDSEGGKQKLEPLVRFNRLQNETSSAMILILGDLKSQERAEEIYQKAVTMGKMPAEVKEKQLATIVPMYDNTSIEVMTNIVHVDASLVAMQLMLVARAHGYDTNAIGGFDKAKAAEVFGLDPERYVPVMILAIGKAAEEGYESVRLDASDITSFH